MQIQQFAGLGWMLLFVISVGTIGKRRKACIAQVGILITQWYILMRGKSLDITLLDAINSSHADFFFFFRILIK